MKRILLFTMMCLFGLFSLNAQETSFFYDFEDGTLNGWNVSKGSGSTGPDWAVGSGSYYGGQGDSYAAYSMSYGTSSYVAKNYLITAQKYLITETSVFSWWVKHTYPGYEQADEYQMVVSEDGTTYTPLYDGYFVQGENEKEVSLSAYAGKELYLGFYHYGQGGDAICLDNIRLSSDSEGGEGGETPEPEPEPVAQQYRVKLVSNTNSSVGVGQYLTIESYAAHTDGPAGGVALKDYAESNAQIFTLEDAGNNTYYFRSADGYYIYCQSWNVDAYSTAYDMTALGMTDLGDGTFYLMNGTKHFKVEYVNNTDFNGNYPFCDASTASTTWTLEEVINDDLEPAVPTNLVATAESYESISLTWDEAENAVKYNVYQGTDLFAEGVTGTSYTATGLNPETEYCFTVTAVRGAKESTVSTEACATTLVFEGCIVEFVLKDSYGDGWNGNTLVVTGSDGVSEVLGLTGGSSTTYTLQFAKGAHVTLLFTNNGNTYTYPQENSLIVRYESGIEIINQAEGSLTSGLTFEFDVDCTPVAPEAPTVVAQTLSDTEIALTLTAAGAETFTIYQGTEVLVENYAEATYVVSGLTPETEYCFTAKSFNEVGASELSEEVCATTYKEGTMIVQVGESDGYTAWSTPVADYYYYSMSQTIYTAEEIGVEAGSIISVAYNKASGAHNTRNIAVYMKHTNDTMLTAWDSFTSEMCVYNGTYTFGEPGWNTIDLQEAFSYEGGNLLVCVVDNTAVNATSYDMFYTYKPGVQRAIYGQSSSSPIDPSNTTINCLPIYDNSYGVRSPQTKFVIEASDETPTPSIAAPQNLVATVNGQNSITLTWDAVDGAEDYYVYKDGTMWANTSGATTYTENDLAAGTEYCFAVQAAGAAGESELSAEVCATTLGEGGEGGGDEPAEITHRLIGIYQNEWNNVAYTYESETSNVVTEVVSGSYKTVLEYNEDGQIVKTTYAWVDPSTGEMDLSNYTLVTYTYEDGVLVSYKEEIINPWNPSSTEYTFTYEEDFVVKEWPNAKETYAFEDGRLVEKTKYYYDQWAETPDFIKENMVKYEYDENGNCVTETQYNTYGEEPTPQNGVEYYYDMTIAAENVATFAYPHEFLPTHANLVTKALLYYYQEDWQTGEVSKSNFEVKTYNYSPEVAAAPFAPMELKANVVSDVEISLTWVSIEAAESFNVYCNGELAGNATETYFSVTGLTAGTEYCFTVKGVNSGVESEASNEACATTMQLVNVVPNAIAFGDVKMGEFWTETSTGVEVKIDLLGKTITSIATDNDFFRVPATINLTEEPVAFKVDYKKSAEAGEYTGNLVVTLSTDETVTIPLSATAYNPVAPDVFELAQEIEFVEGAYTDAPDFATLHDDYNLPNEAEGNNPDAVYTFTLDTESVVNVEVTGENAVYATYKAFGEEEGPTAANAFFGDETILKTSFSYDFESADLSDFTIVDNDEFKDYTWTVENGSLVSYSFVYDNDTYAVIANDADERLITNKAYAITANSVLTLDINVNGSGGNFNFGEAVFIEVTQDGETFTQVGVAYDDETTYSYDFMSKRINLGAKFAELGLEYGEYQIVLHHDQSNYGHISVDNFALTERVNVYTAGTYYLVAAAPAAFEVNVEVAAQEMPVAPKAYRLVSAENHEKTTFVYDETDVNRVVKIESGATVDVLEYNTDGTLAGYKTIATYEDPELGNVEQEMGAVSYVYENGRIVSYSETVQSPMGGTFDVESVITYNAEGQVESVENVAYESVTNYVYNAEGLLSEKVTAYVYGDEVSYDSKEVYTYENGKLVKLEYMYYDWESEEGEWYVVEEYAYTYDANGNCTLVSAYQFNEDFETGEVTKSLYNTTEYYYNTEVLAEEVYTFEYPHFALLDPAKPAAVNVITKDMSYYSYFNEEVGEVVNHTYVLTVYNYDPEILSAPYAPFNLTAEATGESTVALTWEAYADAETFVVYNGTEKVAEGIEGFEYTVEGLKAATEYCFTVKAVNAAGESVASNEACATTEEAAVTVPAVPANLVAEAVSTSSIELTWDAVATATSYNVYQGDNKVATVEEATYTVEGLEYNTEYCFTVTAVNEAGESEKSAQVCEKTLGEGIEELSVSVNIYPNPVENVLFIETEAFVEAISIYTVTGTLIYKEVDFNSNTIDVSEFNGGVYIMKIRTENGETVQRFVKK